MKKILLCLALVYANIAAFAQPAARNVIVEHFTNTYCSVCASRNPGFYNNLWQFPQVLHIAYHPSAPYVACPLNQHNKTENDARTNFYGVYGATPRIVIQGKVIPAANDYTSAALFQDEQGKTSPFEMKIYMQTMSQTSGYMKAVVKRVDTGSADSLYLYGAIVEDTLFFNASNGETKHYDVFRKELDNRYLAMPANVGDSAIFISHFSLHTAWNANRIYSIAMLQQSDKQVVQAGKSNHFTTTLNMNTFVRSHNYSIYPNPSTGIITVNGIEKDVEVYITGMDGKTFMKQNITGRANYINVTSLPAGVYFLRINNGEHVETLKFVRAAD